MGYIVKGNFSASLNHDFIEVVGDAQVRIYGIEKEPHKNSEFGQNKKVLQVLTKKEVSEKEACLIGKGKTDSEGNYEIELSDAYHDGPIAIDLKLTYLLGHKKTNNAPVQFTVREVTPVWRPENDALQYSLNYCFPFEFWSNIRATFNAWTICGHIKSSENGQESISGATVFAFDVDWIKDDELGSSVSDAKGYFKIDFDSADFKRTFLSPIVNIETPISSIPGPGVYFKVTAKDGSVLYKEDRAEGRTEERKNIPRCYCVDLFLNCTKNKTVF